MLSRNASVSKYSKSTSSGCSNTLRGQGDIQGISELFQSDQQRFEFKSTAARNNALKLLEQNDFDYDLIEDLTDCVVKLSKVEKYALILKNSIATKETDCEDIPDE